MITELEEKIAGEITMSEEPGAVIRKWRLMFDISQVDLAKKMDIAPSVISDYEKGRRKPGVHFLRDIVNSMIDVDEGRGGEVVKRFSPPGQEGITSIGEYTKSMSIGELADVIAGEVLVEGDMDRKIYGYTIIDSLKAITSMKSFDFLRIYGWSTERALFFQGVEHGRSPMVAVRSSPLTPAVIVYIQPDDVDDLTLKLARIEGVTLMKTELDSDELQEKMMKI
ncbi:MAG: helix-turn-helix domain-containing protein [Thermoplasmatota archaeon]